jgi:aminoglycoside phosphotransferase (APT) family kinase protein
MRLHDDQVEVGEGTVRRLVADQFPAWAALPVRAVRSAATVNAIFRIGEDLAARLPLRREDPAQVRAWLSGEAAAARELADVSPVPTPLPVGLGEPGHGYPLPWSVQTWLPGRDATVEDPAGSTAFADDLVALLTRLRAADTRGRRFRGGGRGGDLTDSDEWMAVCFARSERLLDVPLLRAMWAELRVLPAVDADVMCHGDLTPPNLLVEGGRLAGLLDGGGFGPADPALDLVAAWHLLDEGPREAVRTGLGCGEVQWLRGMAWAFQQAMGLVWYYAASNPSMSRWGRRTLDRLVAAWTTGPVRGR